MTSTAGTRSIVMPRLARFGASLSFGIAIVAKSFGTAR